ncbi:efflux transporter outer membrane subunit [Robbsia andropogonis]|uniref:efflux transporter outer membrane subunit n=1 Tax=Robbsia andropogonis TaxID=28092 RepID=UPI003F4FD04E
MHYLKRYIAPRFARLAPPVALSVMTAWVLSACSMAPHYEKPSIGTPTAFKESAAQVSDASDTDTTPEVSDPGARTQWKVAAPSDQLPRGEWWRIFGDTTLDGLESRAVSASPTLQAAFARVNESRATRDTARAGLFPSLGAGFGPTREKVSGASQLLSDNATVPSQTLWRAQATASYEVDLFGRVSDSVRAARADAEQSDALYRSVLLTLQADVAQQYFALRSLDADRDVLRRTITLRKQALDLVQRRFAEGDISELDVARARSELASAQSDAMTVERQRASAEHKLAVLVGSTPESFTMPDSPLQAVHVIVPAGLPSSLLERRPDIAAAERAMAAANARIGVAKAAYFPSLSLTGTAGFEAATLGDLFKWSSRAFVLGPLTGTALTLPIFDGGRRRAQLAQSRARFDEQAANYRSQVLNAFQEVEDSLSDLCILRTQRDTVAVAVQASARAASLSRRQYAEGEVDYLSVIDSERTALQSERTATQLAGVQAAATVALIRALGGGWGAVAGVGSAPRM